MRSAAKLTYGGVARALKFTDKPPKSDLADSMASDLRGSLRSIDAPARAPHAARCCFISSCPKSKIGPDLTTGAPIAV